MAIFKCKMCGGGLEVTEGASVCQCAYCGTTQTLPRLTDERRAALYDRANHLRRNDDYDKAAAIYEQILNEDNTDAEAYWSLVLCTYGVVYVENPGTHKHTPTVNRVQYTTIFDDSNYMSALRYADPAQRAVYEAEAAAINEIQKGILAISRQEAPYDVFICYKEKDGEGNRTPDSVLAQELYYELVELGYKVFFSRITLEGKLGTAYEPYIFAALNSAKVMVVVATDKEYVNAPWVKNEWNRYLSLIKGGAKKMLIPAYKGMDPYDLPEEFAHLQAQNMEKLGFMQDLVHGIEKIVGGKKEERASVGRAASVTDPALEPLLKRIRFFLADGMFAEATEYANKVLDRDPECGEAYVDLLLAQLKCSSIQSLRQQKVPFDELSAYRYAMRYADVETVDWLTSCNKLAQEWQERERFQRQVAAQQQQQLIREGRDEEQQKETWRHRNRKALWIAWAGFVAVMVVSSVACSLVLKMESFDIYIILMLLFGMPSWILGTQVYKLAIDQPKRAYRKRKWCVILAAIITFFAFAVSSDPELVDIPFVSAGTAYWGVAVWFAKFLPIGWQHEEK